MHAWILIGMMGAGKTTIGKLLAEKTGRKFVDTDKLIEKRLGRPISQFFKLYGEDAFREHETAVIFELRAEPIVVATGGGAIIRRENFDHLQQIGKVVYLRSEPKDLIDRLQSSKKKRPLLSTEDWETRLVDILNDRKDKYEAADLIIDVGATEQDDIVDEIVRQMELAD